MEKKSIGKVSQETKDAIKRKSAYSLPNRPSEAGMKPDDIRKAFWQPVVDSSLSAIGEIDRVAEEVNEQLALRDAEFEEEIADREVSEDQIKKTAEENYIALDGKIDERIPFTNHKLQMSAAIVEKPNKEVVAIPISEENGEDTIARRGAGGTLRVGDPQKASDAVTKAFLDAIVEKLIHNGEGDQSIAGNLSILGNLYVSGGTFYNNVGSLQVEDVVIIANANGTPLASLSGYVIRTGEDSAYGILFDNVDQCVKIGYGNFDAESKVFTFREGEAQALATRGKIISGHIPIWDAENNVFVDSGVAFDGSSGNSFVYHVDSEIKNDSRYPVENMAIAKEFARVHSNAEAQADKEAAALAASILATDKKIEETAHPIKKIFDETYEIGRKSEETYDLTIDGNALHELYFRWYCSEGNISVYSYNSKGDEIINISNNIFYYFKRLPANYMERTIGTGSKELMYGYNNFPTKITITNTASYARTVKLVAYGSVESGDGETATDQAIEDFAARAVAYIMERLQAKLDMCVKKTNHGNDGKYVLTEDKQGNISAVKLSNEADGNTAAMRKESGAVAVGDAVEDEDAVNKRFMENTLSEYTKVSEMVRMTSNPLEGMKFGDNVMLDDVSPIGSVKVSVESRNLVPSVYYSSRIAENFPYSVEISGITFTVNADGSVTLNGANNGKDNSSFFIVYSESNPLVLKKGTYIGHTGVENLGLSGYILDPPEYMSFTTPFTLEKDTAFKYLYFGVSKSNKREFKDDTAYPILVRGTEMPTTYIPPTSYETDVVVTGNGKNLFPHSIDEKTSSHKGITVTDSGDGYFTAKGTATDESCVLLHNFGFDVFRNEKFYVSANGGNKNCYMLVELKKDGSKVKSFSPIVDDKFSDGFIMDLSSVQYDSLKIFIRSVSGVNIGTVKFRPQIERGDKYTGYEAYVSESITCKVGEEVVLNASAPIMNIRSDNNDNNVKLVAEYNRDINIAFTEIYNTLKNAIISLGGNV